ncbi:MAG: alpha/beta hydrolase [Bacteroidota bacterium]|nr:alpha/beta hydrolase [Bacteroidota bacterium]
MNTFKLNGISINDYEGSGVPLIFIHAYPLCSRMWDSQVEYFKDKFRVITYDIRGLGYSNELDYDIFTMEELVNDLFDIIDHLKLGKVNVCGLSMGGYIILRAVVREPERFTSIILADTKAEGESNESLINRSNSIIKLKSAKKDEFLDEFLTKLLSEESYKNEKIKSFVGLIMTWMDVKGLCANLIAIATRTTTFYQVKEINIPTLIIVGKKDVLTPPVHSFYLKEKIKNSTFKVIEDAGHLSNMEKPEEFNIAIEEFFQNIKQ